MHFSRTCSHAFSLPALKAYDRVLLKVRHVKCFKFFLKVFVFWKEKPSHVTEPESSGGIVRIGICIGILLKCKEVLNELFFIKRHVTTLY